MILSLSFLALASEDDTEQANLATNVEKCQNELKKLCGRANQSVKDHYQGQLGTTGFTFSNIEQLHPNFDKSCNVLVERFCSFWDEMKRKFVAE